LPNPRMRHPVGCEEDVIDIKIIILLHFVLDRTSIQKTRTPHRPCMMAFLAEETLVVGVYFTITLQFNKKEAVAETATP